MNKMLSILLIEDNPDDARLIEEMLKKTGIKIEMKYVENLSSGIGQIKLDGFDLILLDLGLPDSQGLTALTKLCEIKPEVPVIVLTGLADDDIGTRAVQEGAQDYLIKGQIDKNLLARAIKYAIERKQAEKTLRESENLLRESQNVAGLGSYVLNIPSGLWKSSEVLDKVFGIGEAYERSLEGWVDLVHPEDRTMMADYFKNEVLGNGQIFDKEYRIIRSSDHAGRWVHGLGRLEIDSQGRPLKMFGTIQDITERKESEIRLKESEKKFRDMAEGSLVGVYLIQDGIFRYCNNRLAEIFGYTSEELIDKRGPKFLVYPEDWHIVKENLQRRIDGEIDSVHYSFRGITKNSKTIHVDVYGAKTDYQGRPAVLGTLLDITEHVQAEEQLRHSQKMEAIGTLTGGIAHDFNNILNVIIGYSNMVLDTLKTDSLSHEHMNEVLTAAERAANLTKKLLAFSRKHIGDLKPININQIIVNFQKMLVRIIRENIDLHLDLADRPLIVMADAGHIEQVLMNLASNAMHAMPEGGRLTISTGIQEIDDEYIVVNGYGTPGMYALITASDTGVGIDAETQEKIFEPFFTTKNIGEGTGLGLSISYGIIKQHNGYINVRSGSGEGTMFKIYLPLIEETISFEKKIETPDSLKGGHETILVAEDDASLRDLARIVLESFGYSVITAEDGEDAIMKFMENRDKIQLVILDMIMPKKSGKEVSEAISEKNPRIKILFASGYTMDTVKIKEITESGFEFIHKPFLPKDLLKKVREILDGEEKHNG